MKDGTRFFEIDLLRFVAAFSVLLFHYAFRGWIADNHSPVMFPTLGTFARYGYLGVDLFFIISGFVILMSVWESNLRGFVISRMGRLYPAYWFACTLTAVVVLCAGIPQYAVSWSQYMANLSMFHSFAGIRSIDGVYWTLAVELKFYFLVALLLCVGLQKHYRIFLSVWLTFAVLLRFGYTIKYLNFFLFPEWSSYFIAGSAFYLIHQARLRSHVDWYAWGLVLVSYVCAVLTAVNGLTDLSQNANAQLNPYVVGALITLFFVIFAAIACDLTQSFRSPHCIALGLLTYPLYLIHQNIGYIFFRYFHTLLNDEVLLVSLIALMISVSYAIHTYIEKAGAAAMKTIVTALWDSSALRLQPQAQAKPVPVHSR